METFREKVIIITGSSMGIGKSLAKFLGERGAKIVINGRNEERLLATERELRKTGCEVLSIRGDLGNEENCQNLIEGTLEQFGKIDVLVNNAAISMRGKFEMISPYVISSIFQINAIAPCILSKMALPHIKKTRGSIVFISSSMGFRGLPFTSIYCSTKMSLTALAGALRIEHHWDPIHIGIVYVGPTENDQDKTIMNGDGTPLFLGAMKGFLFFTKEEVAQKIAHNISSRKKQTIIGSLGKFFAFMNRVFPGFTEFLFIHFQREFRRQIKHTFTYHEKVS